MTYRSHWGNEFSFEPEDVYREKERARKAAAVPRPAVLDDAEAAIPRLRQPDEAPDALRALRQPNGGAREP